MRFLSHSIWVIYPTRMGSSPHFTVKVGYLQYFSREVFLMSTGFMTNVICFRGEAIAAHIALVDSREKVRMQVETKRSDVDGGGIPGQTLCCW